MGIYSNMYQVVSYPLGRMRSLDGPGVIAVPEGNFMIKTNMETLMAILTMTMIIWLGDRLIEDGYM